MYSNTILIVDDDPVNLMVLQGILKRDFPLLQATNGIEAVAMAKKHKIDLILMDIMMPRMSGFEACEEIRKDFDKATLPIVFVTAKRAEAEDTNYMTVGGNALLTKPIDKTILINSVFDHIDAVKHDE